MKSLFDYYKSEYTKKLPIFYDPPPAEYVKNQNKAINEYRIDDSDGDSELIKLVYLDIYPKVNVVGFGDIGKGVLKRMDWSGFHPARFYYVPDVDSGRKDIEIFDGRHHIWNDFETIRFVSEPDLFLIISEPGKFYESISRIPDLFGYKAISNLIPIFIGYPKNNEIDIEIAKNIVKRIIVISCDTLKLYYGDLRCNKNVREALIAMISMMIYTSFLGTNKMNQYLGMYLGSFRQAFPENSIAYAGWGEVSSLREKSAQEAVIEAMKTLSIDVDKNYISTDFLGFSVHVVSDRDYLLDDFGPIVQWFKERWDKEVPISFRHSGVKTMKTTALVLASKKYFPLENILRKVYKKYK